MSPDNPKVPSFEEYHDRWARQSLISLEGRVAARLDQLADAVRALSGNLDHIHDDLVGLRERANIPRPQCYPAGKRPRRARKVTVPPPPPPPPAETPASDVEARDEK
ncbi:MAG: hypothetical protein Q8Q14_16995 [Gemmatimonadales bacterium]|nr:hypothetical protein [Gemmatimonadales bacterium]